MRTPFGHAIRTYSSKQEFYDDQPSELKEGWTPQEHPDQPPLGLELVYGLGDQDPRWSVVFCAPRANLRRDPPRGTGTVVAFDHDTGAIHVLAEKIDGPTAKSRYQQL